MTALLLAQDFPPMGGGIARLHGELARRYPRGELIVSTPQNPDAHEVDAQFGGAVDRLPMSRRFTKTLPGLLLWSRRATGLARQHRVRFVHCGNVKPAGYPARWVYERTRVPYGVFLYGADLLSEQHKYHSSKFKRRSRRNNRTTQSSPHPARVIVLPKNTLRRRTAYASWAGAATVAASSAASSGPMRSSASSANTHSCAAAAMPALRCAAIVCPPVPALAPFRTRAPAARADSAVPSADAPSTTITSPAHASPRTHSPICSASLRVGMTIETGVRATMSLEIGRAHV